MRNKIALPTENFESTIKDDTEELLACKLGWYD